MTEQWRDVVGYEGFYQVSDHGQVRRVQAATNTYAGKILRPYISKPGYARVRLWKRGASRYFFIHTLVAHAFLGPQPEWATVNHKDGQKAHNSVGNLEYLSQSDNQKHAYAVLGVKVVAMRGSQKPSSKLTEDTVLRIRELFATGQYLHKELAERFGVHSTTMSNILTGRTWKHVGGPLVQTTYRAVRPVHPGGKLTAEDIATIRTLYATGEYTYAKLAECYDVSSATIGNVITGKTYCDVT